MINQDVTHTGRRVYPDPYGLGQQVEARIALASAENEMAETHFDAFTTGEVTPEWRAMMRRRFYAARAEYEAAKGVLS